MKLKQLLLLSSTLLFCIVCPRASGQTVLALTGHITAEVVESVSATSKVVTGFNLKNVEADVMSINENLQVCDLGNITVNSGTNITCNIIPKSTQVFDSKGNALTINPTIISAVHSNTTGTKKAQTISINATISDVPLNASGLYKGYYSMVFASN